LKISQQPLPLPLLPTLPEMQSKPYLQQPVVLLLDLVLLK
jgi:hypothetical protein